MLAFLSMLKIVPDILHLLLRNTEKLVKNVCVKILAKEGAKGVLLLQKWLCEVTNSNVSVFSTGKDNTKEKIVSPSLDGMWKEKWSTLGFTYLGKACWEVLEALSGCVTKNPESYTTDKDIYLLKYIKGACKSLRMVMLALHQKKVDIQELDDTLSHWAHYSEIGIIIIIIIIIIFIIIIIIVT